MNKKIIFFIAGAIISTQTLFSLNILGRSPAVLPVGGISIEEYKESTPKDDKGYNFKQRSKVDSKNTGKDHKNITTLNPLNQKEGISLWIFFVIALLPLGVWLGIYNFAQVPKKELKKIPPVKPALLKTFVDDDKEKAKDDHHDDDNFKKVS